MERPRAEARIRRHRRRPARWPSHPSSDSAKRRHRVGPTGAENGITAVPWRRADVKCRCTDSPPALPLAPPAVKLKTISTSSASGCAASSLATTGLLTPGVLPAFSTTMPRALVVSARSRRAAAAGRMDTSIRAPPSRNTTRSAVSPGWGTGSTTRSTPALAGATVSGRSRSTTVESPGAITSTHPPNHAPAGILERADQTAAQDALRPDHQHSPRSLSHRTRPSTLKQPPSPGMRASDLAPGGDGVARAGRQHHKQPEAMRSEAGGRTCATPWLEAGASADSPHAPGRDDRREATGRSIIRCRIDVVRKSRCRVRSVVILRNGTIRRVSTPAATAGLRCARSFRSEPRWRVDGRGAGCHAGWPIFAATSAWRRVFSATPADAHRARRARARRCTAPTAASRSGQAS